MTDLINEIQEAARIEGFTEGTKFGYMQGEEDIYPEAFAKGLEEGQIEGYGEGIAAGFEQGYDEAEAKYQNVIAALESLVGAFKV